MELNLVTTIIPVFNRPSMLVSAVQSVLAQDYRPIEIIIADDGSTDATPSIAKQLVDKNPDLIRYVRIDNSGPGPAREAGRLIARGEFIQYLDSDDRLLPNKFTDQVRLLREHLEVDIAYGKTRLVDENGKILADPFKWTDRDYNSLYPGLLVDRWWCTHTPLYRRSLTDRIGPWCDMRWSQDWQYDSRAGGLGAVVKNCHSFVSEHVHHSGLRQTSAANWESDPIRLRNRVELLCHLWKNAENAQVPATAPERQHFARWAFYIARSCAAQGMQAETEAVLNVADASAQRGPGRRGIRAFKFVSDCVGLQLTGLSYRLLAKLSVRPSKQTLRQSYAAKRNDE